jgi:hypothetical protein
MPTTIDSSATYGRLKPLRVAPRGGSGHERWEFRCECGTVKVARACHVLSGRTQSCGCLHAERAREANARRTGVATGDRFHRLTAVVPDRVVNTVTFWRWRCDCGAETIAGVHKVRSGHTKSCGCFNREASRARRYKHGKGDQKTKEYRAWCGLKQRCHNQRSSAYQDYGGRGITVCDRWLGPDGFDHFFADMGLAPSPAHSVDRLDNSRGYSPDNCAWRTRVEQMNNRRGNVTLTHSGETLTVAEWATRLGLKQVTIRARIRMGWSAERVLTTPLVTSGYPSPRIQHDER